VLRNHRTAPVEAVNQRGADGLHPGLEGDGFSDQRIGAVEFFLDRLLVVIGGAIFGLHEPAGRRDAEDVQVVFDATADKPAVAVERVSVKAGSDARQVGQARTRPVRSGVTAVDIGKDVRSDQIAEANAGGPSVLHLDPAGYPENLILEGSTEAAELPVCEY